MSQLNSVKVFLENGASYETSVSDKATENDATEYFVGKYLTQQDETAIKCIGIEFNGKKIFE